MCQTVQSNGNTKIPAFVELRLWQEEAENEQLNK